MRFSVFLPPQAEKQTKLPALFFLSGLTCTEENFTVKAGAYRIAAELGLIIIAPDTSPRGENIPTGRETDIGFGAGFYINATQEPWIANYQMESYIAKELYRQVLETFPVDEKRTGIFGHSMGGHGALTLAQKYPGQYHSVSAFAPICSPSRSSWGQKVFEHYLGSDTEAWKKHDATELWLKQGSIKPLVLIDEGSNDPFRERLHLHLFEETCKATRQSCTIRRQEGYDHGYFFIQTFMEDHLRHHYQSLNEKIEN